MVASSNDVSIKLKRVGETWFCENEAVLEDLLWRNLSHFFGLVPLKRQFSVDGQICDILALGKEGQLAILELKNIQDRYVINQLTRYYAALMEQKPFQEKIDYSKPVRLIAIAPSFHKDNLSDQKYSLLDIELVEFAISQAENCLIFELKQANGKAVKLEIAHLKETHDFDIPSPPRALLNLLSKCSENEYQNALKLRERILKFDKRIKEITGSSSTCYGSGKTRLCAEFRFDKDRTKLAIFLWLPHGTSTSIRAKKITARMKLWTNWIQVSDIGHVPEGLGKMISFQEWQSASVRPLNKLLPSGRNGTPKEVYFSDPDFREGFVERNKYLRRNPHYKSGLALAINDYMKLIGESEAFDSLVDLALKTWL